MYLPMFTTTLFTITKIGKQLNCTLMDEWIRIIHTHTHIYIHIYTCEHIHKITKPCEKNFARELEKIYQEMYDIYH